MCQIWGCAGGEATRTPPNLEFLPVNPKEPFKSQEEREVLDFFHCLV
jgi:hypothetical protein